MDIQHGAKGIERAALNINPGGWAVEDTKPISTLLGSCVAVCLYDPKIRLAGMNHFLLPSRGHNNFDDTDVVLAGDFAMEVLVNAMINKGAQKGRLIAKAFGGSNIVDSIRMAIGERNSEFARDWLERENIPLVASDFGGSWARKVLCHPCTGDAWCRRTPISSVDTRAEQEYQQSLSVLTPRKIELFL
ncbi:MAG: CheD, stimulates methylation of protein [Proteobacteria bacterium]|nr:CheD, stimulates methylation of protein [Pseudomonadota bacterium]